MLLIFVWEKAEGSNGAPDWSKNSITLNSHLKHWKAISGTVAASRKGFTPYNSE